MYQPRTIAAKRVLITSVSLLVILGVATASYAATIYRSNRESITIQAPGGGSITTNKKAYQNLSPEDKVKSLGVDNSQLYACPGNEADKCKSVPSIDFFPSGSEGASNPELVSSGGKTKEIMGRITTINGNNLTIKTTSGKLIRLAFSNDVLTAFNQNVGPNYPITVGIDDALYVLYDEPATIASQTINQSQIIRSNLVLTSTNPKTDPTIHKY